MGLADEILLEELEVGPSPRKPQPEHQPEPVHALSGEEIFGDPGEAQEILDIFI